MISVWLSKPEIRLSDHFKSLHFPTKKGILFSAPGCSFLGSLGKLRCPLPHSLEGIHTAITPLGSGTGSDSEQNLNNLQTLWVVTLPGFLMPPGLMIGWVSDGPGLPPASPSHREEKLPMPSMELGCGRSLFWEPARNSSPVAEQGGPP